jgi:hypothetical protein
MNSKKRLITNDSDEDDFSPSNFNNKIKAFKNEQLTKKVISLKKFQAFNEHDELLKNTDTETILKSLYDEDDYNDDRDMTNNNNNNNNLDIGLDFGQTTFTIPEIVKKNRTDPIPRQDGLLWKDKQQADDHKWYQKEWMDEAISRLEILRKNPDFAFVEMLAGFADEGVEEFYLESDLDERIRRNRFLQEQQSKKLKLTTDYDNLNNIKQRSEKSLESKNELIENHELYKSYIASFLKSINIQLYKYTKIEQRLIALESIPPDEIDKPIDNSNMALIKEDLIKVIIFLVMYNITSNTKINIVQLKLSELFMIENNTTTIIENLDAPLKNKNVLPNGVLELLAKKRSIDSNIDTIVTYIILNKDKSFIIEYLTNIINTSRIAQRIIIDTKKMLLELYIPEAEGFNKNMLNNQDSYTFFKQEIKQNEIPYFELKKIYAIFKIIDSCYEASFKGFASLKYINVLNAPVNTNRNLIRFDRADIKVLYYEFFKVRTSFIRQYKLSVANLKEQLTSNTSGAPVYDKILRDILDNKIDKNKFSPTNKNSQDVQKTFDKTVNNERVEEASGSDGELSDSDDDDNDNDPDDTIPNEDNANPNVNNNNILRMNNLPYRQLISTVIEKFENFIKEYFRKKSKSRDEVYERKIYNAFINKVANVNIDRLKDIEVSKQSKFKLDFINKNTSIANLFDNFDVLNVYCDKIIEANKKEANVLTEKIQIYDNQIQRLLDSKETLDDINYPYKHDANWVAKPQNSGYVRLKPIFASCVSKGFDTLVEYMDEDRNSSVIDRGVSRDTLYLHKERKANGTIPYRSIPLEVLQNLPFVSPLFAEIVACHMAEAKIKFPKTYKKDKDRLFNKIDKKDTLIRLSKYIIKKVYMDGKYVYEVSLI